MLQRDAGILRWQSLPALLAVPARCDSVERSTAMKWETPQASDHRYGFEVTMYIANR